MWSRLLLVLMPASAVLAQMPGPPFPESLRAYLQLTSAQMDSINGLNRDYDQFAAQKQARVNDVQLDIQQQTSAENLDAMALGVRYAEIESIRRDLNDKRNDLRANISKVLSDPQRPKVKALADARGLLPLAATAGCAYFLTAPPGSYASFLLGVPLTAVLLPLTGVLVGNPFFGVPQPCAAPNGPLPADLTAYLGLSVVQVDAANRLSGDYRKFQAEKQQRLGQLQGDLAEKTAAEVLDPAGMGQDYAEMEAIRRDLRDKEAGLRSDLTKLLADPQKLRLKALDDARGQQALMSAAVCEDLLAPAPVAHWFDTTAFQIPTAAFPSNIIPVTAVTPQRYCGL